MSLVLFFLNYIFKNRITNLLLQISRSKISWMNPWRKRATTFIVLSTPSQSTFKAICNQSSDGLCSHLGDVQRPIIQLTDFSRDFQTNLDERKNHCDWKSNNIKFHVIYCLTILLWQYADTCGDDRNSETQSSWPERSWTTKEDTHEHISLFELQAWASAAVQLSWHACSTRNIQITKKCLNMMYNIRNV